MQHETGGGIEILQSDTLRWTENLSTELPNSCALAYPLGVGTATDPHDLLKAIWGLYLQPRDLKP